MGLATAPDGTICGGTAFPMRFFSYDPNTDQWTNRASYSQWNTVARQGDHFFVGGYPDGFLLDWDPARRWVPTEIDKPDSNPRFLIQCSSDDQSPALPAGSSRWQDARTGRHARIRLHGRRAAVLGSTRPSESVVLTHTDILPEHSTTALVALADGQLLGGTTTAAGTGGEKKAEQAELYILDMATKKVHWHEAVFPGVQEFTAMCAGPNGLVFGIADHSRWFVFDPAARKVVHEENVIATIRSHRLAAGPARVRAR